MASLQENPESPALGAPLQALGQMGQPLLPQPPPNSLLPMPPPGGAVVPPLGLPPPGGSRGLLPPGGLIPPSSGGTMPPHAGFMPPGGPGSTLPPGGLLPPGSTLPPGGPVPPGGSLLPGGPTGSLIHPDVSMPPLEGSPSPIGSGPPLSLPDGTSTTPTDASSPPFAPPKLGLLPPSVQPPLTQPGLVPGGPRMLPPPSMRFHPPGLPPQIPSSGTGMGPPGSRTGMGPPGSGAGIGPPGGGPRPLMGLLPHGQQGHPPPGGPLEVWFEHRTGDGHMYYSHSKTRQTTWERPLNAQIAPQPGPGQPVSPVPGVPFSPSGLPGGAPQLVPTRVWSEHQTPDGKVYFYNKVTRQSVWEKPRDFELIMPLPINFGPPPPATGAGTPGPTPVGGGGGDGSIPPQQGTVETEDSTTDALDGQQGHVDLEAEEVKEEPDPLSLSASSNTELSSSQQEPSTDVPPVSSLLPLPPPHQLKPHVPVSYISATVPQTKPEEEQQPQQQQPQEISLLPAPPPVKKERAGPHPIKSVPVPGTPWSIVWSSDERTFFFNATTRVSLWSMPEELESNPQVEKILEEPSVGKKRVGAVEPSSEAKRFKGEDDNVSDMEEDGEEQQTGRDKLGLQENESGGAADSDQTKLSDVAEIEKKAASARAGKSLEERQKEFQEMLLERGVSAFSTWEKELPKFVFDPRYMLLNTKERKTCFETYIRLRAEEERKEKKTKLKEKRDTFRVLLEEAKLHPKSSFSDFASKYGKDARFKAVEKMREREQMFTDYLAELKKVNRHKEDHHHRHSTKSKAEKIKSDFLAMLGESEAITERSQWRKIKSLFDRDPRYKAVESSSQKEEWFKEHVKEVTNRVDPEQERQERIQASLKEREREVKMSRTAHEKEWGRERDQLRKAEATQHFKALLVDMIRSSEAHWHETKQSLRKDRRWALADQLEPEEKEKLFQDHVEGLFEKKRLQFRRLLEDTSQISLTMPWKKARKLIKEDPRYKNFGEFDHRREMEYDRYLRDKMVEAKNEFRNLLKETKIISYKSHELIRESEKHHKDIVDILKNDQRYLVLDCVADDRERMFEDYVFELHQRGPPPPPTATHPSERLKRPLVT